MIKISLKKMLHTFKGDIKLRFEADIKKGDFVAIFGKSGAGKTTILRMIAGLEEPQKGYIKVDGDVWFDAQNRVNLSPAKREIGFVFQDYALFPNMTVRENLYFALGKGEKKEIAEEVMEVVGLEKLADKFPDKLSGGQKQRVAVARALVRKPKILLLDEPLSALDREMRLYLQEELLKLHKRFNLTTILVSHDPSEIFKLCNFVYKIDEGRVIKKGTPSEVFIKEKITSGFRVVGEILEIEAFEMVYFLTLCIGEEVVKVMISKKERENFKIGDKVQIVSKSFHPMVLKIG